MDAESITETVVKPLDLSMGIYDYDAERLDFGVLKAIRGYWSRQGDSQALAKSLGIQI